jgi:hypothetical protein
MPVEVARELVENTTSRMRSKFARELANMRYNPDPPDATLVPALKSKSKPKGGVSTSTDAHSPTSTDVRSPTKTRTSTSTDAYTSGNVTVTGGAGSGANTKVSIFQQKPTDPKVRTAGVRRGVRANPESDAASMYESFHGAPSTGILVIQDDVHYHEHLAELGVLCGLKVRTVSGYDVTLEFGVVGDGQGQTGNPKHKRKRKGPFTQAYEFGTGIIPGLLKGADSTLANPSPDVERAYHTAMLADETYQRALEQEYGKRAGDMRYRTKEQSAYVHAAGKRMQEAAEAYRMAVAKMRRGNPDTSDIGPVILCSNEVGNQLYLRGGDQSLNLDDLHMEDLKRDFMNIGEVWAIAYSTKKEFDGFAEIEYVHVFGPEKLNVRLPKRADLWEDAEPPKDAAFGCGNLPTITYDTLNCVLGMVGGVYKINKPFLGTSPGIED